jgi:WD40 repeat protein
MKHFILHSRWLFTLILLVTLTVKTQAQVVIPDSPGWPIKQQCVSELPYPTIPQNEWNFEGVIFSWNGDGVRAIRTDLDTSYFVALDGDTSFAFDGVFSPDGRWFAYGKGITEYANMVSNLISVRELAVVSTDPRHQTFSIPWQTYSYSGVDRNIPHFQWLGEEEIVIPEGSIGENIGEAIVNPFTATVKEWPNSIHPYLLYNFSPDFTRAIYQNRYEEDQPVSLYNLENDLLTPLENREQTIKLGLSVWLPDSSGFIASVSYTDTQENPSNALLALIDRQGMLQDIISHTGSFNSAAVSRDGSKLAFTSEHQLFIADMNQKIITDMCFNIPGRSRLAWSPDNIHLAFTHDGYPIILNTLTQEMQILRYQVYDILGWYPV